MTEIRWLNDDERQAWLALTGMLTRLPAALDAQLTRDSGLTFYEYMVLAVLYEEPEHTLRMSLLAERTSGSLSRLSHVARRLEAEGLIRREPVLEDRRATNAVLTVEGTARMIAAAPGHLEYARQLVFDVTDVSDLASFGRVGTQVLTKLDDANTRRPRKVDAAG